VNQPLGVIQLQPVKKQEGEEGNQNQQRSAEKPSMGAHAAAPARSPWQKHQELIENSFLAPSVCVGVLNSSLLFAPEFIIICFTVTSGGQSRTTLGAKQTQKAAKLPVAERGAGTGLPAASAAAQGEHGHGAWLWLENQHRNMQREKKGCFPASPPSAAQPRRHCLNYVF